MRALPADDGVKDETPPLSNDLGNTLGSSSPSQLADTLPSTKQVVTVPHSSALRKGKAKRNRTSKKTAPRKAAPSKAQKGKRKRSSSVVESNTGDSDGGSSSSSTEEEEEETNSDESNGLGSGEDDKPPLLSLSKRTMRNTRRNTMDPKRLERPEESIEVAVTAITTASEVVLAVPPSSTHPSLPSPALPSAHTTLPRPTMEGQVELAVPPPSTHPSLPAPALPSHGSTLPTTASSPIASPAHATLLPDPKWPTWFSKAFQLLSACDLGPAFTKAISQYIELERRNGFSIGGPHAGFKKQRRPDEVDWWVGRARMKSPEIKDVSSFGARWWAWWKLLQPSWREVADVEGHLGPVNRKQTVGKDGWSVMDKHGQNAFLTVLATLVWWESGLPGNGQDNASWLAAVEDVSWVMSKVVDAR